MGFSKNTAPTGTIDGFTTPFKTIELASDETGAIVELAVEEGSPVIKGDLIARLDDRIQQINLELAQHDLESDSELDAARRQYEKRQMIGEKLQALQQQGHASHAEKIRSDMELSIARSRFLASQEGAIAKEIEYRRTKVLLDRRRVTAPFDGVVSKIHREEGEFVSPVNPEVVTVIQTNQLLAVFNVPFQSNYPLEAGKPANIRFLDGQVTTGIVHSIGVTVDAESGTFPVKVKIDNSEGMFKSGVQCQLEF